MTDSTCAGGRTTHTTGGTTNATAPAAAGGGGGGGGGAGGGLMCAPILNADGNVIAVCLLSDKLTSPDAVSTFTDDDEKVKGAF